MSWRYKNVLMHHLLEHRKLIMIIKIRIIKNIVSRLISSSRNSKKMEIEIEIK